MFLIDFLLAFEENKGENWGRKRVEQSLVASSEVEELEKRLDFEDMKLGSLSHHRLQLLHVWLPELLVRENEFVDV